VPQRRPTRCVLLCRDRSQQLSAGQSLEVVINTALADDQTAGVELAGPHTAESGGRRAWQPRQRVPMNGMGTSLRMERASGRRTLLSPIDTHETRPRQRDQLQRWPAREMCTARACCSVATGHTSTSGAVQSKLRRPNCRRETRESDPPYEVSEWLLRSCRVVFGRNVLSAGAGAACDGVGVALSRPVTKRCYSLYYVCCSVATGHKPPERGAK
jgi:hypothetical protein